MIRLDLIEIHEAFAVKEEPWNATMPGCGSLVRS